MSTDLERIGHALYGLDAAIRSVGVMLILGLLAIAIVLAVRSK